MSMPHYYLMPGMSLETRRALRDLTSGEAFRARVTKANKHLARSRQRRTILSTCKRELRYYGRETCPRFTIRTDIRPEDAAECIERLKALGVPAEAIEVVGRSQEVAAD